MIRSIGWTASGLDTGSGRWPEDAELDASLLLPDRPSAVDIEGRSTRPSWRSRGGHRLLRGSEAFPSGESRLIALGSLLLRLDRIGELATLLEENATLVMDSATLQILVANRHLLGEDRDEQAASAALERAERLGADDEGVLRRVATLRLQDPGLRSTAREAIERIDGLGDSERALMLLALDAEGSGLADGLEEADRLITRSRELIDRYPNIRPAWAWNDRRWPLRRGPPRLERLTSRGRGDRGRPPPFEPDRRTSWTFDRSRATPATLN